ncbi:MAG: TetR/AcrR family transcriptional regulator [Myxococcota bacterium]
MSATADGRSTRASQKRRSRRRAILQAARRVFGERGYHRTHVADLIEAAGIARGTFYLYFESKGAVFVELLDEVLDELRESIVGVDTSDGAPGVETQLVGTVQRLLRKVIENRLLTAIIVREAVGLDEEVDRRLGAFYGELLDYIQRALDEGKRMGFVRDLDTSVAAFCVLGTIKQLMEQLISPSGEPVDVDAVAFAMLDFNLRGVLKTR